jgi:hypothetical protein
MLVTKMEANYFKKAKEKTFFTCIQGEEIAKAVEESVTTNESKTITVKSTGKNEKDELIAEFFFTWSFKTKK